MTFAQGDRTGHAITRRLSAGRLAAQATSVLFLGLPMSLHRLLRVRFADRRRCVNGLHVRLRNFHVQGVRLDERVCFLPGLINVTRRYRIDHGRNQGTHFLNHVSGNARRFSVLVMGSNVRYRVALRSVFVANPNCLTWVFSNGYVNQAYARIRILGAGVGEVNSYLSDYHRQFT